LRRGATVITDRFADSTRVYQGTTRGDLVRLVDDLHRMMIGTEPDLTFVIDMSPTEALARARRRAGGEDRFESFGPGFQMLLRQGFVTLAQRAPARVRLIDGAGSADDVAARIALELEQNPA
jgi:dTMP kinase